MNDLKQRTHDLQQTLHILRRKLIAEGVYAEEIDEAVQMAIAIEALVEMHYEDN